MKILKTMLIGIFLLIILLIAYMKFSNSNINDIGLRFLSWIKLIKGDSVNVSNFNDKETTPIKHEAWSVLLKKNVSNTGKVNYNDFISDKKELEDYLNTLSNTPPGSNWNEEEKLAYWINAYNAFTVQLIIDHYPLKSIKEISNGLPMINSPWDIKFFKIGNIDFDLNTIEHQILRKEFVEPRIHFAINCASFSCPQLKNEAFEADKLEKQLEEQTHHFINNTDKNKITESVSKLSKLFSWFESDFLKKGSIESLLKKHHKDFNKQNKVEFLEYDWSLNE